ncbi:MAG: hypothetical protein WCF33_19975 [Pseudonocardiaceae bacterium]
MTPSSTPFDPVVSEKSLGPLGSPISNNNGESEGVYPLIEHCGWLLKVFKSHLITDADMTRIDQLVALAANASASDRVLLNSHMSWPAARVTSTSHMTYGVVIPIAPPAYWVNLRLNESQTKYKPLEIDWLASAPEKCERHNVPVPNFANRVKICADIVAVAELLERHNLVYGDWSYANALWSADECAGYVIDLDGCAFGTRTSLGTQNWDDPHATGKQTDTFSDRYGVALLLARCLTGERDIRLALEALQKIAVEHDATSLYDRVYSGVITAERGNRPTVAMLLVALRAAEIGAQATVGGVAPATADGVVSWVPIPKPRGQTAPETRPPSAPNLNPRSGDPGWSELLTDFTKTALVVIEMIALIILSSIVAGSLVSIFFG